MSNKRGQGVIGFVLIVDFFFVLNWAMWLGALLGRIGQDAVTAGATGVEALFWMNLNLMILIFLVLINLAVFKFGGES